MENCEIKEEISVKNLINEEKEYGLKNISTYTSFNENVKRIKRETLNALIKIKEDGKTIAAYGAAAKGNTFLNYCGIGKDFIDYVVDANPHKQGLFLPGSHIPIVSIDEMKKNIPDYIIILPWNLEKEINDYINTVIMSNINLMTCIPNIKYIKNGNKEE